MKCRPGCAACCIAPSISSSIPGMPNGKPAGVRCIQLTENGMCKIFGTDERPEVCVNLKPSDEMCGQGADAAISFLNMLELATIP
ncbi:YkgJ family cysteine cluster protein [Desulforegula conservatrix]|uniref:YkgJ family cysteine cluster protein n=1 Tax=Desulforegula conservatrix TaxID=153026 RepID=UPI00041FB816|nr:YkgJ family cysteine cluster protein [Desulforegula conservatrix]